ncbi:hypothetical protein FBY14_12453 [Azospirillum brasilense]|nr:hypothetical protein FBY14_12453 [Azospirillum brasilense]
MVRNHCTGTMETPVSAMTDQEVIAYRRWPAHLTVAQMREQIAWWQSPEFRRVPC